MLREAVGSAVYPGEPSVLLQDVSHSYYPSCNPGATPETPRHRRRVYLLNKTSDCGDGLDYPQPSIRGSDAEPRRSRTDAAAGVVMGIDLVDHIVLGDSRYCSFKEMGKL